MTTPAPDATPTTPTGALTERYLHAATRSLSEEQRADVALELRASIEDGIEARMAADAQLTHGLAEHLTLTEMGDPDRLAADYRGAAQHLVGPALYPLYLRTLKVILSVGVPAVTAVTVAVDALDGAAIGPIVGQGAWVAFTATIQICFWTTLAFVLAERSENPTGATDSMGLQAWTPEQLPHLPKAPRAAFGEMVTNVVWLGILGFLIVWQQVAPPIRFGDDHHRVIDPSLWSFWIPVILVMLAAEAAFEVVKYRAGGVWTIPFAALNTATGLLFAAPVAWLASQEKLLDPGMVAAVQQEWSGFDASTAHTVVLLVVIAIWAMDSIDGWRKALRA